MADIDRCAALTVPTKIIVFDGVCVLCSRWVRFVLAHDRRGEFQFAAMQSDSGRNLLLQYGLDPDSPASFLLLDAGRSYVDSEAIIRVLHTLSGPWRVLSVALQSVPQRWRDAGYRYIARHRYCWFGRLTVCSVPTPQNAHRFLR